MAAWDRGAASATARGRSKDFLPSGVDRSSGAWDQGIAPKYCYPHDSSKRADDMRDYNFKRSYPMLDSLGKVLQNQPPPLLTLPFRLRVICTLRREVHHNQQIFIMRHHHENFVLRIRFNDLGNRSLRLIGIVRYAFAVFRPCETWVTDVVPMPVTLDDCLNTLSV
ncbi:hypothetical protein MBM_09649 [Drepanopeziza brunnea f. sp. 'multigermtubi' MB_m1]|uniref:Uncharacterized protein n=1 Tax=Marssonina brunnea f. sp. multigermtubi (strain MB_m1) TaxID=1072389 RepID=K1W5K6_MARBU|nr:uncharacterized protein MBM_09649 [Drepanopeziza brunnea f. sp. 'multigermtubi' MB_m1]EKD12150.1 hypothetical protein MBM_09649 [Drepanopeziza brunnea f. sp. 'multigermtubi' MB_m1]